jgi:hypothetical protein
VVVASGAPVVWREYAANERNNGKHVLLIIADRVYIPPAITTIWHRAIK